MLNNEVENFRLIARESLKLDMIKRGVDVTRNARNFLDYELNDDLFLNCKTKFGCQSDWVDMVCYIRKLNVSVT